MRRPIGTAALILGLAALPLGGAPPAARAQQCASVMDVLTGSSNFKTAVQAFNAADLGGLLAQPGPFTVFAPDEAAFAKIPKWQLNIALHNKGMISSIVKYHIVNGEAVTSARLQQATSLPTLNGKSLKVAVQGGTVVLDGKAKVLNAGTACGNGIVYEIDTVLRP